MKLIIITLFLIKSNQASTDTLNLKKDLYYILSDIPNNLNRAKGAFKEISPDGDSTFFSKFTITGTSKNEIRIGMFNGHRTLYYDANIDSVSKSEGKKVAKIWRRKVDKALDKSFKENELKMTFGESGGVAGYLFRKDRTTISITYTYSNHPNIGSNCDLAIQAEYDDI